MTNIVKLEGLLTPLADHPLSAVDLQRDAVLIAQGWERRFTIDVERIAEVAALYSQLGFEVRVEPLQSNQVMNGCQTCHSTAAEQFKTIYTRKKKE